MSTVASGNDRYRPAPIGSDRPANGRNRRNLAVHRGLDEGRVAMPFADPHHCGVNDLRPGTPRLRASWIEARATKVPRIAASFSKQRGARRARYHPRPLRWGGSHHRLDRRQKTGEAPAPRLQAAEGRRLRRRSPHSIVVTFASACSPSSSCQYWRIRTTTLARPRLNSSTLRYGMGPIARG